MNEIDWITVANIVRFVCFVEVFAIVLCSIAVLAYYSNLYAQGKRTKRIKHILCVSASYIGLTTLAGIEMFLRMNTVLKLQSIVTFVCLTLGIYGLSLLLRNYIAILRDEEQ